MSDTPIVPPQRETLTVEFKSDRACLSDKDLVEALAALANTNGGELWLGIEDDGTPTGLHKKHRNLQGLPALIQTRTSPPLAVEVRAVETGGVTVARISVKKSRTEVATTAGVYLRRRIKHDGTPESVPMLPHERSSRAGHFGLADASAQAVPDATLADFDPLERERLRQSVQRYGGDRVLLELSDEDMDGALGLTTRNENGERVPTLTGLLIIGRETALREKVPTHEFAFQVLSREAVGFNEFHRFPLLKAMEWLETNFRPYNPEDEMLIDMFRVPIPKVDMGAFREALANALIHRDYHNLRAVYVRLNDDELTISNPGGLVEGVTLQNLLTTEPRPRNPALADAMKRIGIVERSGRGVDKIYRGLLRFGRPVPDYSRSNDQQVVVGMPTSAADKAFLKLIVSQEKDGQEMPVNSLIALAALYEHKRMDSESLAEKIQRDHQTAHAVLERLVEAGLVEAHGNTRNRSYTLSALVYRAEGQAVAYTRQAGFNELQQEQMVLAHISYHGSIRRSEVMALCRLADKQATRLLKKLESEGKIQANGQRRWTFYTLPQ
ncbi:MAG: putative DNA binding domain-containing protein [Neisseria sp.]|jgi:putative transcriptional regulator|uniref:ATP-binding protein n=1 Tax=Neisseria sicca TaxID=490 RepID=UPI0012B83C78|nr:ATP-binding protein [Neisseria sicca]MBS6045948.1 putative DNA binding domain-containing protein [Neisseria sp.]